MVVSPLHSFCSPNFHSLPIRCHRNLSYYIALLTLALPLQSIAKFRTEDEVITKANSSIYGLSNAIFMSDVSSAARLASALDSGQVTVNT